MGQGCGFPGCSGGAGLLGILVVVGCGDGGYLAMTREDLVKQVMGRGKVPAGREGEAHRAIEGWVKFFPVGFKFGPASVMACERLVKRELKLR